LVINVLTDTASSAGETLQFVRGDATYTLTAVAAGPPGPFQFEGGTRSAAAQDLTRAINETPEIRNGIGVEATWNGGAIVTLVSLTPGSEGSESQVGLFPASGNRTVAGFSLTLQTASFGLTPSASAMEGGADSPMNGARLPMAPTPLRLTGLTERLPMGILLQDADFIGEDPLRNGVSSLQLHAGGGGETPEGDAPILGDSEYGRIQGPAGYLGMADGSILVYAPWTLSTPSGTRKFRLFRGGGSAYVLDPTPSGGPVGFSAGGLSGGDEPVVKGAVLAGRAFLVRNYQEEAFSESSTRTYGDEVQMVIVTEGHVGEGALCPHGYALDGQISPTGYGKGFAASDRYRLEGKPLVSGHSESSPDPDISGELAPYPSEDESDPNPCP
jgi:hypothetical protein